MSQNPMTEFTYKSPDGKFDITMTLKKSRTIFCVIHGEEEIESTIIVIQALRDFQQQIGKLLLIYGDVSGVKSLSAESRSMWFKDIWGKKASIAEKFAVFGVNFFLRTVVNMFAKISKVQIKSFANDKQATKWLGDTD